MITPDLDELRKNAEVYLDSNARYIDTTGPSRFSMEDGCLMNEIGPCLAAFIRDITDPTPADREWVERVSPIIEGGYGDHHALVLCDDGSLFVTTDLDEFHVAGPWFRGRVRLFALAMGLTLREDNHG